MREQSLSYGATQSAVRHRRVSLCTGWLIFTMIKQVDQRKCIRFCFKLGHSSTKTIGMIKKAFRDDSVSEAQIKVWYWWFRDGWEYFERNPRSGRPATSRTLEDVECCNQRKSAIDSVRIRGRSGYSTERDFDGGSWHESYDGKIFSAAPVTRAGVSCWSCTGLAWDL